MACMVCTFKDRKTGEEKDILISRTLHRQSPYGDMVMHKEYYDKDGILVYSTDCTSEAYATYELLKVQFLDDYIEQQTGDKRQPEKGFFKQLLREFHF